MSRDRAKFTATLHAEQQKVQIGLIGDASVSEELQKKNHLSTLKFDSFESVNLDRVPSPRFKHVNKLIHVLQLQKQ